jgi:TrmH family RNA methyltransferase
MPRKVRIVLVRCRNPLNMGAVARAMANFGLDDLVLVEPYGAAWREARSARAGAAVLEAARVAASLPEALDGCQLAIGTTAGTARTPELRLEDWATLAPTLPGEPLAVVFGSERTGLSQDEISHCHRLARISTAEGAPSMNLGQAVAVCAYELTRHPEPAMPAQPAAISAVELNRILDAWYPLLESVNAVRPTHRPSQTRLLREMLTRWRMRPEDARRLLGLARQLRHSLS